MQLCTNNIIIAKTNNYVEDLLSHIREGDAVGGDRHPLFVARFISVPLR